MKLNFKRKKLYLFPKLVDNWGLLLFLTIAAYLGNYFHLYLFFGAHFLFGSIAIWLIVWRYGLFWGILASLIASFHTFILWHHPYAIIIFTLETILVGFFWQQRKSNLIILDGLYWLMIGMPLIWIFYRGVMSISTISSLLILLKQPVNGFFNSLIASLVMSFAPHFPQKLKFHKHQTNLSLKQTFFNILVAFILFPSLIFMISDGREILKQIEIEITNDLIANKVATVHLIEQWYHSYDIALKEASQFLGKPQSDFTPELKLLLKTFSDFKSIIFVQQNNSQEIALSFRTFLIISQKNNQEYSCTIESGTLIDNFLYFKIPMSSEVNDSSCVLGKINKNHLTGIIKTVSRRDELQISLFDNQNQLVVSNQALQNTVNFEQGRQQLVREEIYQWFPEEKGLPLMIQWSKSLYWTGDTINNDIPWQLRILIPAKTYIYTLQKNYIFNFFLMLFLSLIALFVSWLVTKKLVNPLSDLAKITNNLPEKLFANLAQISHKDELKLELPESSIMEIDALINNFNNMSKVLSQGVEESYQINQDLLQKTNQLAKANEELEFRTSLLQKTKEAAEVANRAKSTFIANMSHELRTPLNAVLGFTKLMSRDSNLTLKQMDNLDIINRSGEHLLSIINDILNLSKIESGQMTIKAQNFSLHSLLINVKEMFKEKAENQGIELLWEYSLDLPNYIKTDEQKLRQVLINILSNALKFTQKGSITLRMSSVKSEGKLITINCEVEDTGGGISSEDLDILFKPFIQAKTNTFQEGTGLGLPISRKFVRLMGGDLTLSSILGKGTIAKFNFVVESVTKDKIKNRSLSQKIIGLKPGQPNYRILVVDDRWENRQLLAQLLESIGFNVLEAENGKEAISIWSSWRPHLIWMDIRMPVLDGYKATQYIKSHSKEQETIIIALTAHAFEENRANIIAAGCDDYVRKPFCESIIWDKMAEYLNISYLYSDSQIVPNSIANKSFKLEASDLQIMPTEWLTKLETASWELDEEVIAELLKQIPDEHLLLIDALQYKLNNFDFGTISDLAQQARTS